MKIYTTRWRIVEFIRNFIEQRSYAPTIEEIRKGLDISSKSVVNYHLKALEEEGIIDRVPEVARAMDISGVGKRARAVALLGTIAAGQPIPVPTEETWHMTAQETVEVPADMLPRNVRAFALRVKGTSMIDAFVDDGDIVVLEATSVAENGQMVAAWLTEEQKDCPWSQGQIRNGLAASAPWAVQVVRDGRYRFELCRWPKHLNKPAGCTHAKLRIGSVKAEKDIKPGDAIVTFELDVKAGPAMLQSWMTREDGKVFGAYYVWVERQKD